MCRKRLTLILFLASVLIFIPSVFASHFLSISGLSVSYCDLTKYGIQTLTLTTTSDVETFYEDQVNGSTIGYGLLIDSSGVYPSDTFSVGSFPYSFKTTITIVSISTGDTLETYTITGTCTATNTGTIERVSSISGSSSSSSSRPRCPVFHDGRINHCDTFTSVVLYGVDAGDDGWRLDVYYADGGGLALSIPASAINEVERCPANNTLIYADETTGISLWNLTQRGWTPEGVPICPYQLNAPMMNGEPNKTYTAIFYELYPNTYYESFNEFITGQ